MNEFISFLSEHGYAVVFGFVLADQLGLPVPSLPVLLAAGALVDAGQLNLAMILGLAALGAFLSDLIWFEIGRRRGNSVLRLACRASLEPESCIRRTEAAFARHRSWSLIASKFVPGFNVVAAPLAGIGGMKRARFLGLNACGAGLFAIVLVLPGYIFGHELEGVATLVARAGNWALAVCFTALVVYILVKYVRRVRFFRTLRIARISADELKEKLEAGECVTIIDLRDALDFAAAPRMLPGAIRLPLEEVARRHHEIPRDRETVLYCTCPDEFTSARVALLLKRHGLHRVRPLAGGYDAWARKNFSPRPMAAGERDEHSSSVHLDPEPVL